MWIQKSISIIVIFSFILMGIRFIPSASAHEEYVTEYWLHPSGTVSVSGWTPSPGDGNYSNKLLTNDTNTTYIWSSAVNQVIRLDMDDLAIKLNDNERMTVILRTVFRANFSGSVLQMKAVILTYSYQSRYSGVLTYNGVWHNYSVTMDVDAYFDSDWEPYKVNATQVEYTSLILGKVVITETSLRCIIWTEQTEIDYNAYFLLIISVLIIIAIIAIGVMKNEGKKR